MTDHLVDVVNEKDEVIGQQLKSKKKELGFISRVVGIFLINSKNEFIVCKRAPHKKEFANLYDLSAFGNVIAGESYISAAKRELKEELDIDCKLKSLDVFYEEVEYEGRKFRIFCGVFFGKSDQEPKLNEELLECKKMSFDEIEHELKTNKVKYCQGFVTDFNNVREKLKILIK